MHLRPAAVGGFAGAILGAWLVVATGDLWPNVPLILLCIVIGVVSGTVVED